MGLFFDMDKGDIGFTFDDTYGMDSEGNMKMRIGDNMAIDEKGDISFVAGWENKDSSADDRFDRQ